MPRKPVVKTVEIVLEGPKMLLGGTKVVGLSSNFVPPPGSSELSNGTIHAIQSIAMELHTQFVSKVTKLLSDAVTADTPKSAE